MIIDEALIDFGGTSANELLPKYENLIVVQTYSKSRSMAGMRIGYAMANKELIAALNVIKNSYNSYTMSREAIRLGAEAVKDVDYFKETLSKIISTREDTKQRLEALGFDCLDSKANFLFITHQSIKAVELFEYLKEKHIFVRYFNKPRISNYLRVTIGTDQEMERFLEAVSLYMK